MRHYVLESVRVPIVVLMHHHLMEALHPVRMTHVRTIVLISEHLMTMIAIFINSTVIF